MIKTLSDWAERFFFSSPLLFWFVDIQAGRPRILHFTKPSRVQCSSTLHGKKTSVPLQPRQRVRRVRATESAKSMTWSTTTTTTPPPPNPSKLGNPSTHQTQTVAVLFSPLLHQSSPDSCCALSRGYETGKASRRAAADRGKRITKVCLYLSGIFIEFGMFAGPTASRVVVLLFDGYRPHFCNKLLL